MEIQICVYDKNVNKIIRETCLLNKTQHMLFLDNE